jgi:DUF4097 and DUF4098 domain-containing protein YvlB
MQKSFDVQGPVELEVRIPTGQIEVDTSLEGGVEVELVAHDDESQRLLDDARIELSDRHGRPSILVDVPQKRGFGFSLSFGRSGISCRIRCPKDSGLSVRTKSADTIIRGTLGGLNAQGASGDVEVDIVTGGVNVKSASGDFNGREVGPTNVQTASGDISIEIARGPVNVQSASGDVSIDEAYDNVSATTVSGDQSHGAVMQGTVQAQAVSGDVEIAVRRGSKVYLDCSTLSGDTHSELELTTDAPSGDGPQLDIQARTVSGDIRITRAPAPTNNDTQEVHA